ARAPARAMTRGSPKRSPGALRPSWVRVGCDIRAKAGLSKTHPWPTFSVSSSRALIARARDWSSGRWCRRRATPRFNCNPHTFLWGECAVTGDDRLSWAVVDFEGAGREG